MKPVFIRSFLIVVYVFLAGCNNEITPEHKEYFNPYYVRLKEAVDSTKFKALLALDSAFYAAPEVGVVDQLRRYEARSAYFYRIGEDRDLQTAMLYADSLVDLASKHTSNMDVVNLYVAGLSWKVSLFAALKNYDSSYKYLTEYKTTINTYIKDSCAVERTNTLSNLFFKQAKYKEAIQHYAENVRFALACPPLTFERFSLVQGSLHSIALSYVYLDINDSIKVYLDSATNFIQHNAPLYPGEQAFMELAIGVVNNTRGLLAENLKEFDKAENFYRTSIRQLDDQYPLFTLDSRFQLAYLLLGQQKYEEMRKVIAELDHKIKATPDDYSTGLLYDVKYNYFKKLNQFDSAIYYLNASHKSKLKLEKETKQLMQSDLLKEIKYQEEEAKSDRLGKDVSEKRFQLTIAVLSCLIAVIIIFFIWKYYRRSAKHVSELKELTTKIQHSNDELQQSLILLQESQARNARMVRMIAHDLKNPIAGIRSMAVFLAKGSQQSEDAKEALDLIKNACNSSLVTINELVSENGSSASRKMELLNLKELLENCVQLLQARADEKKQQIVLDTDSLMIEVNREKLGRVVSNLIHNAIKFSERNSVINVTLRKDSENAVLTVADNGIGIPKHIGEKIFEMESTKSRSGTEGEKSNGLGLAIVKQLVEEHHGKVWYESSGAGGSTFFVSLPIVDDLSMN